MLFQTENPEPTKVAENAEDEVDDVVVDVVETEQMSPKRWASPLLPEKLLFGFNLKLKYSCKYLKAMKLMKYLDPCLQNFVFDHFSHQNFCISRWCSAYLDFWSHSFIVLARSVAQMQI